MTNRVNHTNSFILSQIKTITKSPKKKKKKKKTKTKTKTNPHL